MVAGAAPQVPVGSAQGMWLTPQQEVPRGRVDLSGMSGDLMSNSPPSMWQDFSMKLTLMVTMRDQNVLLTVSSRGQDLCGLAQAGPGVLVAWGLPCDLVGHFTPHIPFLSRAVDGISEYLRPCTCGAHSLPMLWRTETACSP